MRVRLLVALPVEICPIQERGKYCQKKKKKAQHERREMFIIICQGHILHVIKLLFFYTLTT